MWNVLSPMQPLCLPWSHSRWHCLTWWRSSWSSLKGLCTLGPLHSRLEHLTHHWFHASHHCITGHWYTLTRLTMLAHHLFHRLTLQSIRYHLRVHHMQVTVFMVDVQPWFILTNQDPSRNVWFCPLHHSTTTGTTTWNSLSHVLWSHRCGVSNREPDSPIQWWFLGHGHPSLWHLRACLFTNVSRHHWPA